MANDSRLSKNTHETNQFQKARAPFRGSLNQKTTNKHVTRRRLIAEASIGERGRENRKGAPHGNRSSVEKRPIADKEAFKATDRHPHINPYRGRRQVFSLGTLDPREIPRRNGERKSNLPKTRYLLARSSGKQTHAAQNRDNRGPWSP